MKRFLLTLSACLLIILPAAGVHADSPKNKGLLISPLRQFMSIDANTTKKASFTVANLTDDPLVVNLSIQQFSVTDYNYRYTFGTPSNNWLHLDTTSISLRPNQSQSITYSATVPTGAAPGGHYYTLFASANLASGDVVNTVRDADLLFLTVNGKLSSVSHLQSSSIQWLVFGKSIGFNLDPINTGNEHSFVYVSGQLKGLFVKPAQTSAAHLLLPGKVHALSDSIASPLLPGVYKAVYGYKTESNWIIQQTHWVIFIPPWFIAFVLALLLFFGRFLPGRKRKAKLVAPPEAD